jgi:carboxyl-terminal processing protease
MFRIVIILAVFIFCRQNLNAQTPDSVRIYIDSALYFMQTKALSSKNLNWDVIKDSVFKISEGTKTYSETTPALLYAFKQLKDYHGMFANKDTLYRYPPPVNFEEVLSPGIKKEFLKGNRMVTNHLHGNIAYLRIPTMPVVQQKDMDELANRLRDSLCMLIAKNPKGIIIDLRMNNGGNSAPMISGVGPLFHLDTLGYGVDRDGNFLSPTRLIDGVVVNDKGEKTVTVNNTCAVSKDFPIAVLIGKSTLSSAEILAIFLGQQSNVKTFGEPTVGYSNATEGFLFCNKEGYLLLSVNKIANARKIVNEDMLVRPDVEIKNLDNFDKLEEDPTVVAALNWLRKK